MVVVYVAGPFRGPTAWDIAENIRAAERIGLLVALAGAMPLIPHANTAYFHGQKDAQFWIDGTLELLRRSDGAVFIKGWTDSAGSQGEFAHCLDVKKPHLHIDFLHPCEYLDAIRSFVASLENGQVNQPKE